MCGAKQRRARRTLAETLAALLTDFDFLESKVRATSVYDLEADYEMILRDWGGDDEDQHRSREDR